MSGDSGTDTDTAGRKNTSYTSGGAPSILVIGDGLIAAATISFLEQAGVNPVLATSVSNGPQTNVRILSEPSLSLLERTGLRKPIERVGTPVYGLCCLNTDDKWTASNDTSLVAVEQDRIQRVVERHVLDRLTESEQLVTAINPIDSGVRVTFEGTTTERFDAVITTTRSCLPSQQRVVSGQTVDTWEFPCSNCETQRGILTEAWDDRVAAFSVPISQGRSIRLVSASEIPPDAALSTDILRERFGHLVSGTPFDELDQRDLYYRQVPCAVPRQLPSNGVVLVGSDARFSIPCDCIGSTLGIEDVLVLADALAEGPPNIESALAEYVHRRRSRVRDIISTTCDRCVPADDTAKINPMLRQFCAKRRLVLGHIVDQSLPSLADPWTKNL